MRMIGTITVLLVGLVCTVFAFETFQDEAIWGLAENYFVVPDEAPKWVAYAGGGLMLIVFLGVPPALMRRHSHGGEDTLGNIGIGTIAVGLAVGIALAIVGAGALFGAGFFSAQP